MNTQEPREKEGFDRLVGTTVAVVSGKTVKSGPLYMLFFCIGLVVGYGLAG